MAENVAREQQYTNSCRVCNKEDGLRRCSSCKLAYYCSQNHQQSDWRNHKKECKMINNNSKMANNNPMKEKNLPQQQLQASTWPVNVNRDSSSNSNSDDSLANEGTSENENINVIADKITEISKIQHQTSSKYEDSKKKERENKHQSDFKNLSENTMQISDINLLNPNLLSRYLFSCSLLV